MEKSVKKISKKSSQNTFWLVGMLAIFFICGRAQAGFDDIKKYPQNIWDLELTSRYLSTNSNFTSAGGAYTTLPSAYGYSLADFNLAFRSTVTGNNWAIWGDTQVSYAQSKSPVQSLTNANVTHARLGTDYILFEDEFSLIPEFAVLYPLSTNSFTNNSTVAISDGVTVASAKMYLRIKIYNLWLQGFSGYIYRDQGRSSLVPYGVTAEYLLHNWSIGANLQGYSSAVTDTNTNTPGLQNQWFTAVNGGSEIFDSVNPQLLETNVWLKFHPSRKYSFFIGAGDSINGANMANYWDAQVGIEYHFGTAKRKRSWHENSDGFNEETSDGVDQRLFVQPQDDEMTVLPPTPRAQPPPQQNMQNELDKTEMQIELKSVKKKKKRPRVDPDNNQ